MRLARGVPTDPELDDECIDRIERQNAWTDRRPRRVSTLGLLLRAQPIAAVQRSAMGQPQPTGQALVKVCRRSDCRSRGRRNRLHAGVANAFHPYAREALGLSERTKAELPIADRRAAVERAAR